MIVGEDTDASLLIEQTLMVDPVIKFANYGVHEWELTLADVSSNKFLLVSLPIGFPKPEVEEDNSWDSSSIGQRQLSGHGSSSVTFLCTYRSSGR